MYQFHYFSCRQPSRFPPATAPPELFVARLPFFTIFLISCCCFPRLNPYCLDFLEFTSWASFDDTLFGGAQDNFKNNNVPGRFPRPPRNVHPVCGGQSRICFPGSGIRLGKGCIESCYFASFRVWEYLLFSPYTHDGAFFRVWSSSLEMVSPRKADGCSAPVVATAKAGSVLILGTFVFSSFFLHQTFFPPLYIYYLEISELMCLSMTWMLTVWETFGSLKSEN